MLVGHDINNMYVAIYMLNINFFCQGATPKDLAVQFQKQDCVDFLTSAEVEADIFEYNEGNDITEFRISLRFT